MGKALSDYAGAIDALALVPMVGPGIAAILKAVVQAQGDNLKQRADLDETKEILREALVKANNKIIVVIDDIDRLTNSQIRDIFQLVKQLADFPNVIYVLAMDREVVCSALAEVHNIDGNEYLEKIIQVPVELPELRKSKVYNIFLQKLDQIIRELPGAKVDGNYWGAVFRNCVAPYINTLRDINRVINTFQFKCEMLYQEIAFEDMVGLTVLEVLEPKLYKWICNNEDAVCGGFSQRLRVNNEEETDYRKLYHDEFENLGVNPDLAINCVSTMFPSFTSDGKEYLYGYQPTSNIRGNMRVADAGRFELYFMSNLEDIKVSRNIINACVYMYDRDTLIKTIETINEQGNIIYFLEEMQSLVEEIPYERLSLIAGVFFGLYGELKGKTSRGIFSLDAYSMAEYLANKVIKKLKTEEERFAVIRPAVATVNKAGLGVTAGFINRIELAYGRLAGRSQDKDKQIISLEHLEELEKIYVKRICAVEKEEQLLDLEGFYKAFYLWECFDKNGAKDYVEKLLQNDMTKLQFICATAGRWEGTDGGGWGFSEDYYSEYISEEEVYQLIQGYGKKKLSVFTETEQIKLASFALNYEKQEIDYASEKDARELVNKWKESEEEPEVLQL